MPGLWVDHLHPPDAEGGVRLRREPEPDGSAGASDIGDFPFPPSAEGG